jgi:hypothetical protein
MQQHTEVLTHSLKPEEMEEKSKLPQQLTYSQGKVKVGEETGRLTVHS